jgi:hypothetical protein
MLGICTIVWLTAACGGAGADSPDGGGDDGDGDGGGGDDTTAPTVVSVSPASGAAGVREDATVVFVFSEPMDQLSVQNSVDTSALGGVTFAWSDGGTTLTITPDAPLAYAEGAGNDPDATAAIQYDVTVGTGGADEAGNVLAVGAQTVFTTLKSMSTTFGRDNALTGAGTPDGVTTDADDFCYVGDDALGAAAKGYRGYITMDLAALPATAVEIVSATLEGAQLAEIGNPYGALADSAGLILEHAVFTLGDSNADNAAFNGTPLSQVGTFADAGDTNLSVDVTPQVQDDLAHRGERSSRSQYRLRFSQFTNLDATADYVLIGRDELALDVVYLVP